MSRIRQFGFIPGLILFAALTVFYSWNWYLEARLHQAVRVHFIANSDRPADQRLKLQVRNAVLNNLNADMKDINDRSTAVAYVGAHLHDIEQAASTEIARQGCHYPVEAAVGQKYYGWRTSGGVVFSPGRYTSLTVTIGQGAGHNWWGVLYPPFCLVSEDNNHSGVEVRCKLWDLACGLKGKIVEK